MTGHPATHLHDIVDTPRHSDAAPRWVATGAEADAIDAAEYGIRPARDLLTAPNVLHRVEDRMRAAGIPVHDADLAEAGVRALLRLVGDDPDRPGVEDTPARFVKAYRELCAAPGDPATLLGKTFAVEGSHEAISVGPVPFTSVCEHHLLPFTGTAWIAYIPAADAGTVVGLSKLPRLLHHYAGRPQVQERLTAQVAQALVDHLAPHGAAVQVRAAHTCMSLRGVKVDGAAMVTTSLHGVYRTDPAARAEFLALTR